MVTVRECLNQALDEEMSSNSKVFILGEEIGASGGHKGVTRNLQSKYGKFRVLDTPISEAGFTGLAVGASFLGLKPIVEFMTWNFALQSIDHIINSCAKTLYMSGGRIKCPIVFRGPSGFNPGYAAQHTQEFFNYYGCIPGLKVVAPYSASDHKNLLKAAIQDEGPVIFLENEMLYDRDFPNIKTETQSLDKAVVELKGTDVTLIGISSTVGVCLEAANIVKGEVSVEVINLISIRPIDYKTINRSVKKTKMLFVVDNSWPCFSVASEIAANVSEEFFERLKAPVQRLNGLDVPTPYAKNLEDYCFPTSQTVAELIRLICSHKQYT